MRRQYKLVADLYLVTALLMLLGGLIAGILSALNYVYPLLLKDYPGFAGLRPMHVSAMLFWILIGASGCVYSVLFRWRTNRMTQLIATMQLALWLVAIACIFRSYFIGRFGGREYWEFDPQYAILIAAAWLLFIINFFRETVSVSQWPVYLWMWMTGIIFFFLSFAENYLWLLPYFREHFVTDMTIQWKANGSLVGAWNQIIYGTGFFLMERIGENKNVAYSRMAFIMYFLGLFNLLFNWGHHIYTLPTDSYVRYTGYVVSMTEWVFLLRIMYNWKSAVQEMQKNYHQMPYRFLMMSEIWIFINMAQAICMSVPVLNLYTHGTHVTVAHAMGTTIGINTMILFAACFEFTGISKPGQKNHYPLFAFWLTQASLFVFWLSLNIAGVKKGMWQMQADHGTFGSMMDDLKPWYILFATSGCLLALGLGTLGIAVLRRLKTSMLPVEVAAEADVQKIFQDTE